MSADKMGQTADLTTAGLVRWAGARTRERNFWIALAVATLLHASLFIGAVGSKPKVLGDPTGAEDAISVSLVTEADLQSRATVAEEPTPPPSPKEGPANPPQQRPPEPPKPEAKQEPQPEPPKPSEPETQEAQPSQSQPDTAKPDEKPDEQKLAKEEEISPDDSAPDLLTLPDEKPEDMRSEEKPKVKPKPEAAKPVAKPQQPQKTQKKKLSSLDLSTPQDEIPNFGASRSAGLQRPPGITRSGVNDAFARAVIRALQQTMPQLTDKFGRVTVRILLSESGNVVEVRLLQGSKDSALNQDVVFAARQTSYPIPPVGSNLADRTFMVTYIYD